MDFIGLLGWEMTRISSFPFQPAIRSCDLFPAALLLLAARKPPIRFALIPLPSGFHFSNSAGASHIRERPSDLFQTLFAVDTLVGAARACQARRAGVIRFGAHDGIFLQAEVMRATCLAGWNISGPLFSLRIDTPNHRWPCRAARQAVLYRKEALGHLAQWRLRVRVAGRIRTAAAVAVPGFGGTPVRGMPRPDNRSYGGKDGANAVS